MQSQTKLYGSGSFAESVRPAVVVNVLAFTTSRNRLMLVLEKCGECPYEGKWTVPGTSIGVKENADLAALRCLKEGMGVTDVGIEQLYTFSDIDRDPRERTISVCYIAMVPKEKIDSCELNLKEQETERALCFVKRNGAGFRLVPAEDFSCGCREIRSGDLAFDNADMIQTAIERMAGKIDYTEIGFSFLNDPKRFTLTELRHIYDAVKGRASDIGNFRRFIKNRYISTGRIVNNSDDRKEMEHAGRPASTYSYTEAD